MAEKKKKDKDRGKYSLTSMQEVSYQREFKMADRAGGYHDKKTRLQKEKRKRLAEVFSIHGQLPNCK